ncbi:formate--tetrahydrofolate ligase [Gottfriedia acidiceleris]|uniref:Formate--tetrahydrofolate ligase n=1 Tax=Gottfriedia acidiceleris TaxID=371036 RepID=A0ABY4JRK0_9BACI|nr:formate--tetrahydrofolate ligase [Gottfriedia acidiceleris]UPM56046.1 formate--tetrahydrofolate ligase [Gottfriedia acidiceleris]
MSQVKSDLEIAFESEMKKINEIADNLNLFDEEVENYGHYKAKLSLSILDRLKENEDGKLILVTSINPTPAGEGKSTVTVGLAQAFHKIGKNAIVALREPSLGPTMGVKGGATGGGYSQVLPMDDINLHFNGDIHAITTTNNALAAFIDNHIHQGNELEIDVRRIAWKRVVDLNDRALRNVVVGLGGPSGGVPREDGFDITVASEIMAVLCLATSIQDLKERLKRIVVAYTIHKTPVTVGDLKVEGALSLLLKDAIKPNLVQTIEHTPAIIHGGPFANIAHGCNSVIATKMAMKLGEYVVTEAGFGADLGAEKFLNIKTRALGVTPDAVVIVATIRALKMHGGVNKNELTNENALAVKDGIQNIEKHVETVRKFNVPVVVAINKFISDSEEEISVLKQWGQDNGIRIVLTEVWEYGGKGGVELAESLVSMLKDPKDKFNYLYELSDSIENKIEKIAKEVYGADGVNISPKAKKQILEFNENGWGNLPICMAKSQYSLSDQPSLVGRPTGFKVEIRELKASIGAGFIVALTGNVMTMPGLPKKPAALNMDVDELGRPKGLF